MWKNEKWKKAKARKGDAAVASRDESRSGQARPDFRMPKPGLWKTFKAWACPMAYYRPFFGMARPFWKPTMALKAS